MHTSIRSFKTHNRLRYRASISHLFWVEIRKLTRVSNCLMSLVLYIQQKEAWRQKKEQFIKARADVLEKLYQV